MYCKICEACFRSVWRRPEIEKHVHHLNIESLSLSAAQGCRLCSDLFERALAHTGSYLEPLTTWNWFSDGETEHRISVYLEMSPECPATVFPFSNSPATSKCLTMSPCPGLDGEESNHRHAVANNTGLQQTCNNIRNWLDECSHVHGGDCNPDVDQSWAPTRLLHIDQNGGVKIPTSFSDGAVRYITLSHRWAISGDEQP